MRFDVGGCFRVAVDNVGHDRVGRWHRAATDILGCVAEQLRQVGEFAALTALHGQQPSIPDVQVRLAQDEVTGLAARKDAPQEDEEMLGELLDLRLLSPRHDIRGRDGVDSECLASSVDGFLLGVDQVKPNEAVMPLRSRNQVGYLIEAGVSGSVDRRVHDEDLRRLEAVGLDRRRIGLQ